MNRAPGGESLSVKKEIDGSKAGSESWAGKSSVVSRLATPVSSSLGKFVDPAEFGYRREEWFLEVEQMRLRC